MNKLFGFVLCSLITPAVWSAGTGFYSVEKTPEGRWWVRDGKGERTIIRGVDWVIYRGHGCEVDGKRFHYKEWNDAHYASPSEWEKETLARLKDWGFNMLGTGADATLRHRGLAHAWEINFGNKFGTPNPIMFDVVNNDIPARRTVQVRCNGIYSYKLANPLLFYANVCGNVEADYTRDNIDGQLKTELLTALQPAFAKISDMGIRYSSLPGHTMEIADALNEVLSPKWRELRGIEIVSFGVSSVKASEEDEKMLKELQRAAAFKDPTMGAAYTVAAQAEAMKAAASNTNAGPMMAFAGMNMAAQAGGINASNLYAMGAQQAAAAPAAPAQNAGWTCACGKSGNTGKFCSECGAPQPSEDGWTCTCGTLNKGKFCSNCGGKKPAGAPVYKCDKCGWEPEDKSNPPKFCPECGDRFDDDDIVK